MAGFSAEELLSQIIRNPLKAAAFLVFLILVISIFTSDEPKTDPPETFVPNANHVVLVYTDWCPYCQEFKPEWRKFRKMARNMPKLRTSELDAEDKTNKAMIKSLGVKTFPTVVMITPSGQKIKYGGDRSSVDLLRWAGN